MVKHYMRGKNIEELKNKFMTDRLLKRRNRASIELKKSSDLQKPQNQQNCNTIIQKPNRNLSLVHESPSYLSNPE